MIKTLQSLMYCGLCLVLILAMVEGRPQSTLSDSDQELDIVEVPQLEEMRGVYYDVPSQTFYPSRLLEELQMLYDLNRRAPFLRSPLANTVDELYRLPEPKRQVRYRQCYFNPISCFRK